MLKIPVPTELRYDHGGYDITTAKGRKNKYYKQALWSTLEHLKPQYCLEIGTYQFGTAEVFQDYFDTYMPEGKLVTCDIRLWCPKPAKLKNVEFVHVFPHWYDKYIHEWGKDGYLREGWHGKVLDSIYENYKLIRDGFDEFYGVDFTFIDGDHRAICMAKDFEIAKELASDYDRYHIMLEDVDTEELYQESVPYYHNIIKPSLLDLGAEVYEFEDWGFCTNCALIGDMIDD